MNLKDRCAYHDDMGHKTEDCFTLKYAIEGVVRNELVRDEEENYPLVVLAIVMGFEVKRILVKNGSTVEKMGLKEQKLSKASPLYGFENRPFNVKGSIILSVTLRDGGITC
ncbi:hypothetical protein PVK06_011721 [Gossypium arboreum]|uniref:Uncharacterized protein n=1 Tax=Gossypium arboreum TaxID=29729 RepID=A0ABR0Q9H9_GOSAR|nr:hypothetical protein PVK06_011721 [Gossypium arboreum]